jgi:hypothetical protein
MHLTLLASASSSICAPLSFGKEPRYFGKRLVIDALLKFPAF